MDTLEQEVREQYRQLTKRLIAEGLTISTMESATGGLLCSLFTDTEGASAVVRGGLVTYCNEMKVKFGVSEETLQRYSVYSCQVSREMALKCREWFGTDIGIGVTGTTGNVDPNNAEHSVPGKVYFTIAVKDWVNDYVLTMVPQESRLDYKLMIAGDIGDSLGEMV